MKFHLPRLAASAAVVLAAPLLAATAFASEPDQASPAPDQDLVDTPAQEESAVADTNGAVEAQSSDSAPSAAETAESSDADPAPAPTAEAQEAQEERRICRRVRLDAASRRGTRVCMTREEWRTFNTGA